MSHILLSFTLLFTCLYTSPSQADITKDVQGSFQRIEHALNDRNDPLKKVNVLHDSIVEDAIFKVTVKNPVLTPAQNATELQLNKEEYINSFLIGARYVKDYNVNIDLKSVNHNADKHIVSNVAFEETGSVLDPRNLGNNGKPFISKTICTFNHASDLKISSSSCKTDVSFEQQI